MSMDSALFRERVKGMPDQIDVNAWPVNVKATGDSTVNILLTIAIVGATFYAIWTTNQQTILITAQHDAIINLVNENARMVSQWARANDNVFLSSLLPNEKKKDIPPYLQERVREIVEKRADVMTNERNK